MPIGIYNAFNLDGLNDDIESVRVPAGIRATICVHNDAQGECRVFTEDQAVLPPVLRNEASYFLIELV